MLLSFTKRIRGHVPDSCLSCEYSILWEGIEFIKRACGELFSNSKDDSLDKKQIQIIVVKVVKLIFYFQNEYKVSTVIQSIIEGLKLKSIQSFLG